MISKTVLENSSNFLLPLKSILDFALREAVKKSNFDICKECLNGGATVDMDVWRHLCKAWNYGDFRMKTQREQILDIVLEHAKGKIPNFVMFECCVGSSYYSKKLLKVYPCEYLHKLIYRSLKTGAVSSMYLINKYQEHVQYILDKCLRAKNFNLYKSAIWKIDVFEHWDTISAHLNHTLMLTNKTSLLGILSREMKNTDRVVLSAQHKAVLASKIFDHMDIDFLIKDAYVKLICEEICDIKNTDYPIEEEDDEDGDTYKRDETILYTKECYHYEDNSVIEDLSKKMWLKYYSAVPSLDETVIIVQTIKSNLDKFESGYGATENKIKNVADLYNYLSQEGYKLLNVELNFKHTVIEKINELRSDYNKEKLAKALTDETKKFIFALTGFVW